MYFLCINICYGMFKIYCFICICMILNKFVILIDEFGKIFFKGCYSKI